MTITHVFTDLDLVSSPPRKKNSITGLNTRRNKFAVLVGSARANGNHSGLRKGVAGSRTGQENPGRSFLSQTMMNITAVRHQIAEHELSRA